MKNRKHNKMTPEELAVWLHLNRKAHKMPNEKAYNRKREKKKEKAE